MNENLKYWIALNMVEGVGDVTAKKLVAEFGSPEALFKAKKRELTRIKSALETSSDRLIEAISSFSGWMLVDEEINNAKKLGIRIVPMDNPEYPESLRQIYNPPPVFYIKGHLLPEDSLSVAIVGSRIPDRYGRTVTEKIAGGLAGRGVTVVSGMARGIDSIAQEEAVKKGGRTIAVLGSGLDVVYPPENDRLYEQISERGAVISEFPLGTGPLGQNFPQRNRVISGLSLGVIVIQASKKSGSLITASFALDQGRDVFAVPGEAGRKLSFGPNWLIKKGATLVESAEDVLSELGIALSDELPEAVDRTALIESLSEKEKAVYSVFKKEPIHIDEIIKLSGIEPSGVLSVLLSLELSGYIKQMQGKYFQLSL